MLSTEIFSFSGEWKTWRTLKSWGFSGERKTCRARKSWVFSGERKMCWARKSWVFPVNVKRSLSEPEKLKISGRSTFEWAWKNSRFQCKARLSEPEKPKDFSVKHVWVNQKNSRFLCESSRWTDKKWKWANKKCKKNKENSGCSMHLFYTQSKIILRSKYGRKGAFTVEYWRNLHVSGKCFSAEVNRYKFNP